MGEYYVDEGSATSIYSKSHETTVVKIETENGIVGWEGTISCKPKYYCDNYQRYC